MNKRISEIDIIKFLAITLMVVGHADAPFTHFIYLFHMAVFFIASGFVYNGTYSDSLKNLKLLIVNRIKRLYVPFVLYSSFFTLFHNVFLYINVYTDNPNIYNYVSHGLTTVQYEWTIAETLKHMLRGFAFSCYSQLGGAMWFLKILFLVSIGYGIVGLIANKVAKCRKRVLILQAIVSFVLLFIGYLCFQLKVTFWGFEKVATCYWMYFFGNCLGDFRTYYIKWNWKRYLIILVVSFVALLFFNQFGSIALNENSFTNPFYLIVVSVLGWLLLYSISFFIKQTPLERLAIFIGRNTLVIMTLHFLSFKIVCAFIVLIYKLPSFCIAAFPTLYGDQGIWWLIYTIIGVGVPIALKFGCIKAKGRLVRITHRYRQ